MLFFIFQYKFYKCNPQVWEPKYQVIQTDNKQFKNILEYLKYSVVLILMQLVQL